MWPNFIPASAIAELGAWAVGYSRRFTIAASPDGITAITDGSGPIPITGGLHFFTERLGISYPTLADDSGTAVDDAVTRLTLQLATNSNLTLFTSPVPLQLIATPGRQPTTGIQSPGNNDSPPGSALHIPGWPWNSFIPNGTDFQHTFANTSLYAADVDVFWQGWNVPVENCPDEKTFWSVIRRHKPLLAGT